jgi:Flp pilus assembly protein TadD
MSGSLERSLPWLTLAILLNGTYLLVDGSPTLFYVGNVFLHLVLGVSLFVPWWRVGQEVSRSDAGPSRRLGWSLVAVLSMTGVTGLLLLWVGAQYPYRGLLWAHILLGFVAAGGTFVWLVRRQTGARIVARFRLIGGTLVMGLIAIAAKHYGPTRTDYVIRNPGMPPVSLAEETTGGASGPFFPSASETKDGKLIPAEFFLGSESCGRVGCHPDMVEQWQSSAHHLSSFNNQFYRKSIEYMQEVAGLQKPQWCAGCHDPALLFSGQMAQPVSEFIDKPEAHAGLACVACHSMIAVNSTMGNGDYVIEYPRLHDLADSRNRFVRGMHDFLVRLNPKPHRAAFLKPFHREQPAEYCSSCHKVHLDVEVNSYRWIRGFNSYDNWQASGVSGQGARSFYEPAEPKNCVTCHMPLVPSQEAGSKNGFIRSHRFAAANSALPHVTRDAVQAREVETFLKAGQLTVDIFAVSEPEALPPPLDEDVLAGVGRGPQLASTFAVADEVGVDLATGSLTTRATRVFAPLEEGDAVLKRGTSVRLDVVVRTLGLGHLFPSGTVDAQEAWLEIQAVDSRNDTLYWSGWVEDDGRGEVDPSAHFYRNLMVDARANAINKRNAFHTRAVVYVNLIPPGAANVSHHRLEIPEDAGERITVVARLHYRKFNRFYTEFSYAGARDSSQPDAAYSEHFDDGRWIPIAPTSGVSGPTREIPTLPIITLAEDVMTLRVVDDLPRHDRKADDVARTRMRWNDYGIGLLLEGDLKSAEKAFREVVRLDPKYADGWVNLARTYLQEGAVENAREVLDEADRVRPGFHKTDYFRGLYHKVSGEYPEALALLTSVSERFPRDRVVLNDIGRVHFLNLEPEKGIPFFERVLEIDSEDLTAHYNLMLCYRAVGDFDRSRQHERRYQRFKADEDAQAIARQYRSRHPHDNNEAQPIHEHRSWYKSRHSMQTDR